ncbi:hypothetical protein GDO81_000022 [Engystomops pustulosus]|uniref:Uncharacterized protein n=1 Tax=Engystomops pustulosus TaxID=76066 RepID=A0AAV7D350_ENGPU|nr:hypothetical protein GDO81_000022 [Engystomops pustulosus]
MLSSTPRSTAIIQRQELMHKKYGLHHIPGGDNIFFISKIKNKNKGQRQFKNAFRLLSVIMVKWFQCLVQRILFPMFRPTKRLWREALCQPC